MVVSAGVVLDENLRAYALCAERSRTMCSGGPWYSSMGLAFFGGIVVVTGGLLGLRRHGRGRIGAWFPLAAIGAVAALTGIATVILLVTMPL